MSYFGTDPGDLTADEMYGRTPDPVPRPAEPLPNDERNKADIVAALASGDPLALLNIKSRMDDEQIAELKAELARRSPSVQTAIQEQRDAGVAVVEHFAARKAVVTEQTDAAKEGRLQSNDQCPSWHRYLKSQDNLWSALEKWAARVQGENRQ